MFSALFFKESKLKHQGTHTDSGDASKIQIATSGPVARCRWIQVDTGGYDAGIPWYTNGMLQWCGFVGVQAVQLFQLRYSRVFSFHQFSMSNSFDMPLCSRKCRRNRRKPAMRGSSPASNSPPWKFKEDISDHWNIKTQSVSSVSSNWIKTRINSFLIEMWQLMPVWMSSMSGLCVRETTSHFHPNKGPLHQVATHRQYSLSSEDLWDL